MPSYRIEGGDSYPAVEVTLEPGEEFVAEAGAMSWMDPNIEVSTSARGGILSGLSRKFLTGESFFQNTYRAERKAGSVTFVPGSPGSIIQHELDGELNLERGAYLCSDPAIELKSKFEGLKGLFSEGLFILRAVGTGTLFFNGYGDVREIEVDGEYVVDSGYAVAWEPSLRYKITRVKKVRAFLFGDLLIMRFKGRGKLWVQSRSAQALANFFYPFRPQKQSN